MKLKLILSSSLLVAMPMGLFSGGIKNMKSENLKLYQDDVAHNYSKSLGLPSDYSFSNGKPVLPLPPVSAAIGGVMIIGAYPSAVFKRTAWAAVPIDNLKMPFDPTAYPDGINKSAQELDNEYLTPLGLSRHDCWITNLVKVFLFKQGHVQVHGEVKAMAARKGTRQDFASYAQKSLPWLEKELALAKPKLIITLGEEVAGIITGTDSEARVELLNYRIRTIKLNG